jgi:hypothetical protein
VNELLMVAGASISGRQVRVVGVARPLPGGWLGVGDPASGGTIDVVGVSATGIARGAPVEVLGEWKALARHIQVTQVASSSALPDAGLTRQPLADAPMAERRRTRESPFLLKAADLLQRASADRRLSLDTLRDVHALLPDIPAPTRGKLRDGPAVVRLAGAAHFVPPPADAARRAARQFVTALARHLMEDGGEFAPILAADAVARFTDLHPFADGNGRVARAIGTWLLMRAGHAPRIDVDLGDFCREHRREHYLLLRHHEEDPWSWHQFFVDAVLTCFVPPPPRPRNGSVSAPVS